ncbi:hypothetical protein [Paenibacillus marinisediminis]
MIRLNRNKKRIRMFLLLAPLFLVLFYGLTYIPHELIKFKPTEVSRISVFDGNTGYQIEITDPIDIQHMINNLREVKFQKGKLSFGYMGYSFKTTIYNQKGKPIKKLTINSPDTIRYNGFFYTANENKIDYEYIKDLFKKYPLEGQ